MCLGPAKKTQIWNRDTASTEFWFIKSKQNRKIFKISENFFSKVCKCEMTFEQLRWSKIEENFFKELFMKKKFEKEILNGEKICQS